MIKFVQITLIVLSFIGISLNIQAAELSSLKITSNSSVVIITDKSPTPAAKFAANDLMYYLKKSLSCNVRVTDNQDKLNAQDICIFVGPCKAASMLPIDNLRSDYFITRVSKQKIFLAGKDDPGDPFADYFATKTPTMYAVYNLLHRFFGIRWLWPGSSGEIAPKLTAVSIPYMDETNGPGLPLRYSYYHAGKFYSKESRNNMILWGRRNGLGASFKGNVGHNDWKVIGSKYYDEHPEYYALINGKRLQMTWYGKICHSNLELPKIYADYGVNENCDYFSASPNDGRGWCECEECRKLDGPNPVTQEGYPNVSGRVFTFVDRIAKELKPRDSRKMVSIYAYTDYVNPPHNIEEMEDNVLLFIARGINWNYAPSAEAKFKELFSQWSPKCSRIALRDYKDNLRPMQIAPYPKLVDQYIKYLHRTVRNFQGINFSGDDSRDYSLLGPTMYVYAKLLWNPKAQLEDILNEYYKAGWPNSGRYVREYFEFFENRTGEISRKHDIVLYSWRGGDALRVLPSIFSPEALHKGKELLDLAYASAQGQEEKERVDFLRIGLKAVENDMDYFNALIALAKSGEPVLRIPVDSVKQVSFDEKKKLVEQAFAAMEKRQAFLLKYKDSEAIPSAPFLADKTECDTADWDNLIKKLKSEIGLKKNPGAIADPWKFSIDPTEKGTQEGWFKPEYDDSKWDNLITTTFWQNQGYGSSKYPNDGYLGWGWYRKWVKFPQKGNAEDLVLVLGAVDESYDLYVNGNLIKQFRFDITKNPNSWKEPQEISLGKHIKWGEDNLLAVAVNNKAGMGGIWRPCYFKLVQKNLISRDMPRWTKTKGVNIVMDSNEPQSYIVTIPDSMDLPASISVPVNVIREGEKYALSLSACPLKMDKERMPPSGFKNPSWLNCRVMFMQKNGKPIQPVSWPGKALSLNTWTALSYKYQAPALAEQLHITIFFAYPGEYRFRDVTVFEELQ
jgi:hypothetical protein